MCPSPPPHPLPSPELHQAQPVAAQPFHPRPERGHGQELVVDAEPRGREERQVASATGRLHGQQQQIHQEPRTGRQEEGKWWAGNGGGGDTRYRRLAVTTLLVSREVCAAASSYVKSTCSFPAWSDKNVFLTELNTNRHGFFFI